MTNITNKLSNVVLVIAATSLFSFSAVAEESAVTQAEAQQIHGINDKDLTDAQNPKEVWSQVKKIIGERKITGFNREFITDSLLGSLSPIERKNNTEYNFFNNEVDAIFINCVMDLSEGAWGDWSSLSDLLEFIGEKPETHRTSATQAEGARKILHHIANF